ncbi:hypothetical protein ACJJH9_15715 [Microbulbifer sp. DLAB2-AF]|uniref:hypothetical protein n=1 Tax=Microbulbifer sp. DLAB2-AF TaxID=3243395 RepID=UPI0040398CA5
MVYENKHSALRKLFTDSIFLLMLVVLTAAGSISVWGRNTNGDAQELAYIFISVVCGLASLLFIFLFLYQISRVLGVTGNWRVEVNSSSIKLETPDDKEVEPFEYQLRNIKKFAREAYEDDGVWYKWYMYLKSEDGEEKIGVNLGPFSIEKTISQIHQVKTGNIDVVEIDLNGGSSKWTYSLSYKVKEFFNSVFSALIFASFILPALFYLYGIVFK